MTVLDMVQTDAGKNFRANVLAGQSASPAYVEFGSARYTPTTGQTALTTPFSPPIRFTGSSNVRTLRGGLAAGLTGVYHIMLRDILDAAYVVGEVGLFLTDPATNLPVLTDVYSSPGQGGIFGKGQGSSAAWDIVLALEDGTVDIDFPTPAFASLNASALPIGTPTTTGYVVGEETDSPGKPTRRWLMSDLLALGGVVFATQDQAQAAIASLVNNVAMSPLRTWQLIKARMATNALADAGADVDSLMNPALTKRMIERFGVSAPRLVLQTTTASPWDGGTDATLQGLAKPHAGQWLDNADAELKAYGPLAGCSLVKGGIHFDWTDASIASVDLMFEVHGDYLAGMDSENETDALAAQFGLVKTGGGLAFDGLLQKGTAVEAYASQYAFAGISFDEQDNASRNHFARKRWLNSGGGISSFTPVSNQSPEWPSGSLAQIAGRNVDRNWRVYSMTSGVVTVSRNDYLLVAAASNLAPFRLLATLLNVNS